MRLDYNFKPPYVKRIAYVTHMAKPCGYSHRMHAHARDAHEIIYVDYGVINLLVKRKRFTLKPGECFFIPGKMPHSFVSVQNMPFDYMNIIFFGKLPPELALTPIAANKLSMEAMKKLKNESVNQQRDCFCLMSCLITEFIIYLLRQVSGSLPRSLPQAAYRQQYQSQVVNRALAVIDKEYASSLSLEKVAHAAGIGVSRLRQLLKSETGQSFGALLQEQRVAAAKHLLAEGSFCLQEVAMNIGYSDTSFFFKLFKRHTGKTPKAYAESLGDPSDR